MARPTMTVIGTSLGGLHALQMVLGGLPGGFPLPVVVVQHRGTSAEESLCALLQEGCALAVAEPFDREAIVSGRVYVAPAEYHLLVEGDAFALSTEGPVCHSRPSIDVLFESAAEARGAGVLGVVLTGSSDDGARGAARIQERGGLVAVEDPETAESPIMPRAAARSAAVVLPLERIAAWLIARCGEGVEPS